MSDSPTSRTLAVLRERGHVCQRVEYWNAFARKRVDLFECIDIVACTPGGIVGIQCCAGGDHATRRKKAEASARLQAWLASGGQFEIWSWAKRGGRGQRKTWTLRVERIAIDSRQ